MKVNLTLKDRATGRSHTVLVEMSEQTTIGELGRLLTSAAPSLGPMWVNDMLLEGAWPVASLGPLDGSIVWIGGPGPAKPHLGGPRLTVIGGPDAGQVVALTTPRTVVGRGSDCAIRVDDPLLRRNGDFAVGYDGHGYIVEDVGSANGVFVDGVRVAGATRISPGHRWFAGQSEFAIEVAPHPELAVRNADDGSAVMTRQFRSIHSVEPMQLTWPVRPATPEAQPFPWMQVLMPMIFAAVMVVIAVISKVYYIIAFSAAGPIMAVISVTSDRKKRARSQIAAQSAYESARYDAERRVADACAREMEVLNRRVPALPELVTAAVAPSSILWQRRPRDDDYLELRVGTADISSTGVDLKGSSPPPAPILSRAPLTVRLADLGCIGIHGPDASVRAVARSLVYQLCALQGPDDLVMTALLRDAAHDDWEWLRWLPQVRRDSGLVSAGFTPELTESLIGEVASLVDARVAANRNHVGRSGPPTPTFVVLIEDASELRDNPSMAKVLDSGPGVGVYAICCERRRSQLPQECRAAIRVPEDNMTDTSEVEVQGSPPLANVSLDLLAADLAESAARAMSSYRVAGERAEAAGGMPGAVRLLDLMNLRNATPEQIKLRWDSGGRTTRVLIGQSAAGPFLLDVSAHGPHGVIAGTSGAGKSQLLMSLVTALAFENTPEDLNFVLVDFKGGGAFDACADLPHTVSMVTNLEGGQARRAIVALRAESLRRQRLFAKFGADIDTYELARRGGDPSASVKVPRLMIIVDEFAQLAEEHDELLGEFVNVARVGRSLGIHMILATQRPGGIISPQIRANCDLRIALRVADPADSVDVIEKPDAYQIAKTARGRAYIKAADELVEVQTAAVGLPRPGAAVAVEAVVALRPWTEAGLPVTARQVSSGTPIDPTDTDLFLAVSLVRKAHDLGRYVVPPSPVLPPLPDTVVVEHLERPTRVGAAPYGFEDLPEQQLQVTASYHPSDGHLLVVGSPRSGRTTLVRTIVGSLADEWSPTDLHVYALDFGGGQLRAIDQLPHVGAVVGQNQTDRARRLMGRLGALLRERMALFEQLGVGNIEEQRNSGATPLPHVLLLIDRWDVLLEREGGSGEVSSSIKRLITEGAALGVSVILTSDARRGRPLTTDISTSLCLPLNERQEYNDFGVNGRQVPSEVSPGRAYRGGSVNEIQIALLDADPTAAAQNDALATIARAANADPHPEDRLPFRVDELPARAPMGKVLATSTPPEAAASPIAVGGDHLRTFWWTPMDDPIFVVTGPPGSGRTSTLEVIARAFTGMVDITVVDPAGGRLSGTPDARVLTGPDGRTPKLGDLLDTSDSHLLIIDDLEQVTDDADIAALLTDRPPYVAIAVAIGAEQLRQAFRGAAGQLGRLRTGLLLHPQGMTHRGIFGLQNLDRGDVVSEPPGKGLLVTSQGTVMVQAVQPVDE